MMKLFMIAAASVLLLSVCEPAAAQTLRATRVSGRIVVDGRLREAEWAAADSIAELAQVEPNEGGRASGRTVVRALATADALIFGIRCDYAPGTKIVAFARARDAALQSEDHVRLVLDSFRDSRSGYVFAVNVNGARYDALVSNNGESENSNWDGAWEASTARSESGWSVEIRIPIKTLLFKPGLREWGFNVERRTQALQETDRWASPLNDIQLTQTSRAGALTDLPSFELGLGTSIRPSVTGGGARDSAAAPFLAHNQASLDATQRLGGNTLASLTVNTDFAETEVDTRRVNLTRFPLFFPEKRTFFLEGADIFDFGIGLDEDVIPFFSRRVGLLNGQQVPLNVGGKMNGRLGATNFGALVVSTRAVDTLATNATMGALRLRQNVLSESSVGMIATFGDPLGRQGAWLAGPDITYNTSHFRGDKNFLVGLWALGVARQGLTGDRSAAGFKIDYPNDLWDVALRYKRIGESFDPSLGFVPRAGVHIASLGANWQPRPKKPIGPLHIRQCFWENELSYVAGLTGGWQSYEYFMAPINCRLESGDRFEFNIVPTGERFAEPFDVAEGVTIPAGAYHFWRFRLEGGLAAKRRFNAQATWWFGSFYNGHLNQYGITGSWNPWPLFILDLDGERDVGVMPEGRFVQNLIGTRLRLNVSPDFQVTSFVQYSDESHSLGTNTRLRWTFNPLGDVFLVYDHNMQTRNPVSMERDLMFASNQLLLKVQYAFRY